jgi:hypothetical protein
VASNTHKLKIKRKQRIANAGKERKRQIRSKGSTPAFPIHPEKIVEKEPAKKPAAKGKKTKSEE